MSIVRKPLKADAAGKCSRWRVILYNPATHKQEWTTIHGTERAANAYEREQKSKIEARTYVAKSERQTLKQVAECFMREREARNRRTSTLANYKSVLDRHIVPKFGHLEVGTMQKRDVRLWLAELLEGGSSVELVNRLIRVLKSVLFYAMTELEVLDRNIMLRFKSFEGVNPKGKKDRRVNRRAFTETEVQALLAAARPHERALIGLLCFTGMRPGEAYALRRGDVDLNVGSARITRTWDWRGKKFTEPKTKSGNRTVALSGWLVTELGAHLDRSEGVPDSLIFATKTGRAMNPSNVRRDIWAKLLTRAAVAPGDMYSLRHTFASLGRVAGEASFNVARMMGHSNSRLVDAVYAHSLQSGMASVAERVTARALGERPALRVVEGGKAPGTPDIRRSLDDSVAEQTDSIATG